MGRADVKRNSNDEPRGRPYGRLALVGIVLGALLAVAVLAKPWLPLRYGRQEPPRIDAAALELETPLLRRIRELTAEVSSNPYSAEDWGRLGVVYDVHDLPFEAASCFDRAHRLAPDVFEWVYFLGLCKLESDHRDALARFEDAAKIDPDYGPLLLHLARGYFDTERLDEAERHFARAAALEPGLVRPHIGLAQVALARGDAKTAIAELEAALALKPRTGEVHFLLAETHRRLGDEDAAARHLEAAGDRMAFEDFPDRVRAEWQWDAGVTVFWRSTRSARYLQEGLVDRAIAEWTTLLAEDPNSIRAYVELGRIHEMTRDPARALAAYQRALALDPNLPTVQHGVGLILCRAGRLDEGIVHLLRALADLPDDARLLDTLATAYAGLGKFDEAVRYAERALEVTPPDDPKETERAERLEAFRRGELYRPGR